MYIYCLYDTCAYIFFNFRSYIWQNFFGFNTATRDTKMSLVQLLYDLFSRKLQCYHPLPFKYNIIPFINLVSYFMEWL